MRACASRVAQLDLIAATFSDQSIVVGWIPAGAGAAADARKRQGRGGTKGQRGKTTQKATHTRFFVRRLRRPSTRAAGRRGSRWGSANGRLRWVGTTTWAATNRFEFASRGPDRRRGLRRYVRADRGRDRDFVRRSAARRGRDARPDRSAGRRLTLARGRVARRPRVRVCEPAPRSRGVSLVGRRECLRGRRARAARGSGGSSTPRCCARSNGRGIITPLPASRLPNDARRKVSSRLRFRSARHLPQRRIQIRCLARHDFGCNVACGRTRTSRPNPCRSRGSNSQDVFGAG